MTKNVDNQESLEQGGLVERKLRYLGEASPDAIVVIGADGCIQRANAHLGALFGYPHKQLLGTPLETLMPERFRVTAAAERAGASLGEAINLKGLRADGSEFPIEIMIGRLEDEVGSALIVGLVRDCTERCLVENQQSILARELAERVKELHALHQAARILHERRDPADLLRKVVELLPPAWQYPEVTAARITFAGLEACTARFAPSPWRQRADFATEAGERGCIEVAYLKSCPPEAEGPFLAEERRLIDSLADLLSTYFDRIRAEEDRVRLARAEAAQREAQEMNRAKDEFLAMVSHELRSPLHAMLGWTNILRNRGPNAQISRGLEILERNIKLQARLIDDLLDVSRIIAGKLHLDVRPIDLAKLAGFAADGSRPAADEKHIELTTHLEQVGSVSADPQRLQQVIFNLLTNAVKFTPEGGRIDLRLQRVANGARLSVTDTGIGIGKDLLPHVFDRFRQGGTSLAEHHGGLGLGLAIARHLAEMHQGTLSASSAGCGTGATFHLTLPVLPRAAAEHGTG